MHASVKTSHNTWVKSVSSDDGIICFFELFEFNFLFKFELYVELMIRVQKIRIRQNNNFLCKDHISIHKYHPFDNNLGRA